MKILWEKEILNADFGYSDYCCKPIIWNNKLIYAFDKIDKSNISKSGFYGRQVYVVEFSLITGEYSSKHISFDYEFTHSNNKGSKIALTNQWKFIIQTDKIFLYVGFLLEISVQKIKIYDLDYTLKPKAIENEYFINGKTLNYNSLSTIECYDKATNVKLWKIKIKGYLYTNIEYKGGNIIFGTSGKGGALYCVDLNNGKILTEYSNTDASNFEWINNDILVMDIKGNLIKLDPLNCKVIETVLLKDKIFQSPILFDGNMIFTTTHNRKKNLTKVICIQN